MNPNSYGREFLLWISLEDEDVLVLRIIIQLSYMPIQEPGYLFVVQLSFGLGPPTVPHVHGNSIHVPSEACRDVVVCTCSTCRVLFSQSDSHADCTDRATERYFHLAFIDGFKTWMYDTAFCTCCTDSWTSYIWSWSGLGPLYLSIWDSILHLYGAWQPSPQRVVQAWGNLPVMWSITPDRLML